MPPVLGDLNESDDVIDLDESEATPDSSPSFKKPKPAAKKATKTPAAKKPAAKKAANGQNNDAEGGDDPLNIFESIDHATDGGKKRLSIERIYQKKTQLEHILLRPDTYIGSVEFSDKTPMWVYDETQDKIVQREISYVPGLYKIFDEVLVNAADNKQRDKSMNTIKINIDRTKNEISVWNNGKGIPVVHHQVEKVYVPELIFGTLLTSSNYDDTQKKTTGGRNGFGAKLCNIFSKKFTVETSCKEYKKAFKQSWTENMQKAGEAKVTEAVGDDYTKVTFSPDLAKFHMEELDDDIVGLMCRRAYDVAGTSPGVKVFLNGKRLPITGFKAYVEQYLKDKTDDNGEPLKFAYEQVNDRWEVAVTVSDKNLQQVSFVNSIATTKGGRHVDYVADMITVKIIDVIQKKIGKNGMKIRPLQIKNHMWIFVNALIENPSFDSQTKETLTLQSKSFGSKCDLSEKFIAQTMKCGIVETILAWVRFKQSEVMDKKCSGKKTSKIRDMPKLEDANDAGTKNSAACTLILTEGDSAKSLAVSGLGVIGRDKYGVFPLRGKMLNVREASHKQLLENAETNNMIKILGLQYKRKYDTDEDFKSLRYGKVMVMADQDQDGSHIKGLVINFIHYNWPSLIRRNFVEQFITPIVKATKGKEEIPFYSVPEYIEWKKSTDNWNSYRIKYYKGLGTSTAKEAKEYFSDMARHRIRFKYTGQQDDNAMELAFSKKKIEERKDWLTHWMNGRKDRRERNEAEEVFYNKETNQVSFSDFVNKELVLFSNTDNERSIPNLVDGFKPGQRKVLFTCFSRNDKKEVKVAQLAGSVGEKSAYHHGEASLMSTIVNLAQDFVGSNNINVLLPIGQFGTRLQGGKDSASARYIFTMLNPVTRALFPPADDHVLRFLHEENQRIEPEWYCPIIPLVLVNGAAGIGTGWSTNIPNYNPRELVDNIRRMINGEEAQLMVPWFKNFRGTIERLDNTRFVCSGEISIVDDTTIEITELPVRVWTQNYKESVLTPMLGTDKTPAMINDYKEYHTDTTVKFLITMQPDKLQQAEQKGLHTVFKLQNTINTTSMVLFDADGCLRKFERVEDILSDFFKARRAKYVERKRFLEGMLQAQSKKLTNQARFILEKIKGNIVMENKKKRVIVDRLIEMKFDPDPVKRWKEDQKKREMAERGDVSQDEEEEESEQPAVVADAVDSRLSDFDYLVSMALIKLSEEEKDKLLRESQSKEDEYKVLLSKTWSDLWSQDLDNLIVELDKQEEKERQDEQVAVKNALKKKVVEAGGRGKKKLAGLTEVHPSPHGQRVVPRIDAALIKRAADADKAKENKGTGKVRGKPKKEEDDMDTSSLLERVLKKSPEAKAKHERLSMGESGGLKQQSIAKFMTKEKKEPAAKKPAAKKDGKKKEEWESDASETPDESEPDFGDSDEDDFVPEASSKPKTQRARKRIESSDDEPSEKAASSVTNGNEEAKRASPDIFDLDNESDGEPAPKKAAKKPAAAKPKAAPKAAKPASSKAAPKRKPKKEMSDEENDSEVDEPKKKTVKKPISDDDSPPPLAERMARPARAARAAVKYALDDDDSIEDNDDDSDFADTGKGNTSD